MSASYPGAVKTFATRSAGQTIASAHVNDLQDEVTAIEDGLLNGTAPLNSSATTVKSLSVSGGSTLADVTVSSRATLSSLVTLAGYNFTWPSTSPASTGMVLTVSAVPSTLGPSTAGGGTYNLEWRVPTPGFYVADLNSSLTTVTASTVETTIYSWTMPANLITSSGAIRIESYGNGQNFTANYAVKVKFAGYTLGTVAMNGNSEVSSGIVTRGWRVSGLITGRGSTQSTAAVFGGVLTGTIGDDVADGGVATMADIYQTFHSAMYANLTASTNQLIITMQHGSANAAMVSNSLGTVTEVKP